MIQKPRVRAMFTGMTTQKEIARYLEVRDQRHALERQAAALKKEEERLEERLRQCVALYGGRDRTTMRHGYVLAIRAVPGAVRWKEEFQKHFGEEKANQLPKPVRHALHVEPVAKQPLSAE